MNCKTFRDLLYLFQADELTSTERETCEGHLDACEVCAAFAETEERLLRVVRSKLPRAPVPPGLETRIRAVLSAERRPERKPSWFARPWFAASAAAALLIAVLVPTLIYDLPGTASVRGVLLHERVQVVDRECDMAGRSIEQQRECTHPLHLNALKRADGSYLYVSPEQSEFRDLLVGRQVRGSDLMIHGRAVPETATIRLEAVERLAADASFFPPLVAAVHR